MKAKEKKWLTTDYPEIVFEDTGVGRMKKELFDASDKEIDAVLEAYGIPSEPELGKAGTYIQNTPRAEAVAKRKKMMWSSFLLAALNAMAITTIPVLIPLWLPRFVRA